ncbi:MAG: hypothetical protein IPO51_17005 [Dehalococcoidia bacterium]|nr:hypothetical protein [Dehalococcoidia bacterium]
MIRSSAQWWVASAAVVSLATGVALLLAQVLLHPPAGDLIELGVYLALAGVLAVAGCWAAARWMERRVSGCAGRRSWSPCSEARPALRPS